MLEKNNRISTSSTNIVDKPNQFKKIRFPEPIYFPDDEIEQFFENFISFNRLQVTSRAISTILESAELGYSQDQAALFNAILIKEPVIAAHIQTRISTLLSIPWDIQSDSIEVGIGGKCAAIKDTIEKAGFEKLKRDLAWAIPYGYAGDIIRWTPGGGGISNENCSGRIFFRDFCFKSYFSLASQSLSTHRADSKF